MAVISRRDKVDHTPLRQAQLNNLKGGDTLNWCPFGCADGDLDEHGYCGHLIGFYGGSGSMYEPRAVRKMDKRIIVDGSKKQPMKPEFVLAWVTTTARVYSPQLQGNLVVRRVVVDKEQQALDAREAAFMAAAERLRNPPKIDGEWGQSRVYDDTPAAVPAN